MICNYPLCRAAAAWTPVVALPTIRTVGETSEMVQTDKPTYLLFPEVCERHRQTYNLMDWFSSVHDWRYIQEAARANGYLVPEPNLMPVEFKPLYWNPKHTIPIERTH